MQVKNFEATIEFRINQFKKFHKLLMANAPDDYTPFYIPVTKYQKVVDGRVIYSRAPDKSCCGEEWKLINYGNGKHRTICKKCNRSRGSHLQEWARLSYEDCISLIKQNYNIGLSARDFDNLVIIDIDNWVYADTLPDTLISKSRKRCGLHGFYWNNGEKPIPNIPTEDSGEIRASNQYVVIAGSFVPTPSSELDIEIGEKHITEEIKELIIKEQLLGFYTVEKENEVSNIDYDNLPCLFLEADNKQIIKAKAPLKTFEINGKGKKSALFDLRITDLVSIDFDEHKAHPLHSSDTGQNFSVSADNTEIAHCWRHNVSLNALQFLVVKSGYMDCCSAGTSHKGGGSSVTGDNGAIFHSWREAKLSGVIPSDDPIPTRAMVYIAVKHKLIEEKDIEDGWKLPVNVYNEVLRIVEEEY